MPHPAGRLTESHCGILVLSMLSGLGTLKVTWDIIQLPWQVPCWRLKPRHRPFSSGLQPLPAFTHHGIEAYILITELGSTAWTDFEARHETVVPPRWLILKKTADPASLQITGH